MQKVVFISVLLKFVVQTVVFISVLLNVCCADSYVFSCVAESSLCLHFCLSLC